MARILARIEFDGMAHCGWAAQDKTRESQREHKTSVQNEIESALSVVLHLQNSETLSVKGCGRTDSGVSAREYFLHFDFNFKTPDVDFEKLRHSLNGVLPASISVTHLSQVPETFDALENVAQKTYCYRLLFRRAKPTFEANRYWWFPISPEDLNWSEFSLALEKLQGTSRLKAFMAAHSSAKTTQRTIYSIDVTKKMCSQGLGIYVLISFSGAGFLKHMIRNLVGFLTETLQSKKNLKDLLYLLGEDGGQVPTRVEAGVCAPALGLTLEKVEYS